VQQSRPGHTPLFRSSRHCWHSLQGQQHTVIQRVADGDSSAPIA